MGAPNDLNVALAKYLWCWNALFQALPLISPAFAASREESFQETLRPMPKLFLATRFALVSHFISGANRLTPRSCSLRITFRFASNCHMSPSSHTEIAFGANQAAIFLSSGCVDA